MSGPAPRALSTACAWLLLELRAGERRAADVQAAAAAAGIAPRTLERARARIGVEAIKRGRAWFLRLPEVSQ